MHLLPQTTVLLELLHNVIHVCAGGTQVHTLHTHTLVPFVYSVPGSTNRVSPARLILYPGIPDDPFRTSIYLFFFLFLYLLLHSYGSHIYCIIIT
jgi:hypothetical protein